MSLKEEDLIQTCPNCEGEGKIYDPPRSSQNRSYGQSSSGYSSWQSCSRCRSTGKIITEEGEAIVKLIALAKQQNRI